MRRGWIAALAAVGLVAGAPLRAQAEPAVVTVFAAASLTDAFQELGKLYEQRHPGVTVRFNFAGSQQLAAQIEQGAPADVFASADQRWMSYVADNKLLAVAPRVFARNRLVAIVPAANPGRVQRLQDLARRRLKLVLAAEAVPAGRYTRQMLAKLDPLPGFGPDFSTRVLANLVSDEENVKGVVAKVQLGEADAGVVYRSDVTVAVASKVRVLAIPPEADVPASYPIAVVRGAPRPQDARALVDLVLSAEGQAALARHGLLPVAESAR